ncbi:hypothetical protein Sjap_020102 [Stephania japonica]|uniref:At3g05675-like ankyrin-like domain-containing protein n=1 Tax=Stephania japonica TaxID=461633 RepID=A0AAP0F7G9_9MAGN
MGDGYGMKPTAFLNSLFMSTVNSAAKALVSVASTTSGGGSDGESWRAIDHARYLLMLITWLAVWVLRVLMDHIPTSFVPPPDRLLGGGGGILSLGSSSDHSHVSATSFSSSSPSLELILHEGFNYSTNEDIDLAHESSSSKAIGRQLSHIIGLFSEIPSTSRKYQVVVGMADKIVEENMRSGQVVLKEINRSTLSSAFNRTANSLYRSLGSSGRDPEEGDAWPSRMLSALPLGSYVVSYFRGLRFFVNTLLLTAGGSSGGKRALIAASECAVVEEKLAHELLWVTNKLRVSIAVDEALVQWSYASGLASRALYAHPRVQGTLIKISAILIEEIVRGDLEVPRQVKFRILLLWLPLFCYASSGLSYTILTGYEKAEMEKVIDEVISTLPLDDQEQILMNWMHDYATSASDWPNPQNSYYRWFHICRELLV